ncbi:MAG: hypothetical protein GY722_29840 [bacterium]|nr:hypothetical protein [bacterium]
MKRIAFLIAVLAVAVSGCRAEVRMILDVTEDGSGTLASEVAINNQLRDLIDQLAGDGEAIISELDLGLEGESSTRVDGELTVYSTEVTFEDEEAIPEIAAGNFTFFSLEMTDDGTSLEARLDLAGELDFSQFPIAPSSIDPETLEAHMIVSLPGEVTEHNADQITVDGRLSWNIPFESELYMFANTEYPKAGFPWWLVGLLALTGALALGVWLAAVRRDKKGTAVRRPPPEPPVLDSSGDGTPTPRREVKSPPRQHSPFFDFEE